MSWQSLEESSIREDDLGASTASVPRSRGSAFIAWLVIVAAIGCILFAHGPRRPGEAAEPSIGLYEIQAKYLVGLARLFGQNVKDIQAQIESLFGQGPIEQQLMGAVLRGELVGPEIAAKSLEGIDAQFEKTEAKDSDNGNHSIVDLLQAIQAARIDGKDPENVLSAEEWQTARELLPERLGWVGKLALAPSETRDHEARERLLGHARNTVFVIFGAAGLFTCALICGLVLQIVWWFFVGSGQLHSGIEAIRGAGSIYAETFAAWIMLFLALNYSLALLPLPGLGMLSAVIPMFGSLAALAWPVIRGLHWRDVRCDIGLWISPKAWYEPLIGVGAYLAALPIVGMAMIVTLLMMAIASQFAGAADGASPAVHPIVDPILHGNWTVRLSLLLMAVGAAIPEEIMFRGFLYRHLREAGSMFGYLGSVAFASIVSSFVFAVIHPQGLFGIPILMSLAVIFALVREWRGSLLPSMIAHALVNAGTSTVLILIAG